jgi:hypothetical protein
MTPTEKRQVEWLLAQIRDRVAELDRLRARGIRGAALRDRERELDAVRRSLADVVAQH